MILTQYVKNNLVNKMLGTKWGDNRGLISPLNVMVKKAIAGRK